MNYRKLRTSRPPILFTLQVNDSLVRLASEKNNYLPPACLMPRMRDYIESLLLADNLPPKIENIAMLIKKFIQLVALADTGKPIIYKKPNSLSLLFDVCALQSEMLVESPDELVLGYTQTMMGFVLFNTNPEKIAMIGLGGGSLPKYCYRYLPQTSIVIAENDPGVIALRDHFYVPQEDARFQVHCKCGSDFVKNATDQFDVLVVDGFDKKGQPAQLCSQCFYNDCYNALAPDGIMVVNLLGDVLETETYLDRIRLSFDNAVIVIDAHDSLNLIAFACKGNLLDLPEQVLLDRLQSLESQHPVMLRLTAQNILLQRRLNTVARLRA